MTEVSYNVISVVLLVYGLANIVGNVLAGKLVSINASRSIIIMPFARLASYICLFFVAGPHQRHGIGRRLFETFRSRRLSLAPQAPLTVNAAPSAVRAYQRLGFVRTGGEQVAGGIRFVPMKHTL